MFNYVNEEKFIAWYRGHAKASLDDKAILERCARQYMATRRAEFVLPAGESVSGQDEAYAFRFENIGCCGASTLYFYF